MVLCFVADFFAHLSYFFFVVLHPSCVCVCADTMLIITQTHR